MRNGDYNVLKMAFVSLCTIHIIMLSLTHVVAHPTQYPQSIVEAQMDTEGIPSILSWHVHITYMLTNSDQIEKAMEFRDKTAKQFSEYLGPECDGRYDYGYLCMIKDHDFYNTTLKGGPFPIGEWSIFVPVPYYQTVIPWVLQHRGDFSMLIHPNSGFEYEDHSIWASWSGEAWPLDMSIFKKGTQTNEFGHHRGDPGNPVCMPAKAVCGDVSSNTTVICCSNLACLCSQDESLCRCQESGSMEMN